MQGQSPPAAFRGTKKGGAEEDGEEADEQEEDGGGAPNIMDLLPRTDVRFEFTHYLTAPFQHCSIFSTSMLDV